MQKRLHIAAINLLCGLIAVTFLVNVASAQTWTFTSGPYRPHVVKDVSLSKPTGSTQTIYAADTETLKYSTNGGTAWQVTSSAMLNPITVQVSPSDVNLVHVGKLGELWRSADGGTNWGTKKIDDANLVPLRLTVSASNGSYWLLGADTVKRSTTWTTSLYRTTDAGVTWSALNYFRDNAHTNASDVLYHSTDNNTVWVGGSTKPVDQTPEMTDESTYCESCGNKPRKGVWYSSDAGATWTFKALQSATDRNVSAMAFSKNGASEIVFAATTLLNGSTVQAALYQSTNNGTNWTTSADLYTQQQITLVRAMKVNPVTYTMIAAATDKGFAISTNSGLNWSLRNTGLADVQTAYQVIFDKNDGTGNTIYLGTSPTIYKTTDAGVNWSVLTSEYSWMNAASISVNNGTAHAVSNTYTGIARLSSGTWGYLPKVIGLQSFAAQATFINYTNTAYANACGDSATYGVIYTRSDGADGWQRKFTSSAANTKLYALAPDPKGGSQVVYGGGNVYVAGVAKNFLNSFDYGATWSPNTVAGADGAVPIRSFAIDTSAGTLSSNILYAGLGSGTGVRKSTDAGSTWPTAWLNGNTIRTIVLNLGSPSTVYLGDSLGVWKSTDALATTPSPLTTPFTGSKRLLMHPSYPTSVNYLWVITFDGQGIYKTTDAGTNWSQISTTGLPTPFNDLRTDRTSNALIYTATSGGVYKVDPPPETPAGFDITGSNCNPCAETPGPCYAKPFWNSNVEADLAVSGKYSLERSIDGMSNPEVIVTTNATSYIDNDVELGCSGTHRVYYRVRVKDAGGNYSAYSNWVNVKATAVPSVTAMRSGEIKERNGITEFQLYQNNPNPFNPVTFIQYSLASDVHVELKVYDVLGREIRTLVNEIQNAGQKTVQFDGHNLPSGVYLYRLTAGSFRDMKKFVLAK